MSVEKGNEIDNNENTDPKIPPAGNPDPTSGGPESETVSRSAYEKLLREKENLRKGFDEKAQELKDRQEKELKEKEDYKTLFEQKDKELAELKEEVSQSKNITLEGKKRDALKTELSKMGLDPAFHDQLCDAADLKLIKVDSETGTLYGADSVAKIVGEKWAPMFGDKAPNVTQRAADSDPTPNDADLTLDAWKKMSYEDKLKYRDKVFKS